jgi:Fe-S-cluster containining protein
MSGDHNQYQKEKSYLDFECPRCGHCCQGYELGFVDGMQRQMQSSVDKAVNKQRDWVGLTDEEQTQVAKSHRCGLYWREFAQAIEERLKEKNT